MDPTKYILLTSLFIYVSTESNIILVARGRYCPALCVKLWKASGNMDSCVVNNHTCVMYGSKASSGAKDALRQLKIEGNILDGENDISCTKVRERYGRRCSTSRLCDYEKGFCLDGICSCDIGYSYDFDRGHCVDKCTRYGSRFSVYQHSSIVGCNAVVFKRVKSGKRCLKLCERNRKITCINADYHIAGHVCNMCDKTWTSISERHRKYGDEKTWLLLYRHCQ